MLVEEGETGKSSPARRLTVKGGTYAILSEGEGKAP